MRHMLSVERPICGIPSTTGMIGNAVRIIFGDVDCPDCLRRAIAEAEERAITLRELLAKVEAPS